MPAPFATELENEQHLGPHPIGPPLSARRSTAARSGRALIAYARCTARRTCSSLVISSTMPAPRNRIPGRRTHRCRAARGSRSAHARAKSTAGVVDRAFPRAPRRQCHPDAEGAPHGVHEPHATRGAPAAAETRRRCRRRSRNGRRVLRRGVRASPETARSSDGARGQNAPRLGTATGTASAV